MRLAPLGLVLLLVACVGAGPKVPPLGTANPITGDAIATTSLDAPSANAAAEKSVSEQAAAKPAEAKQPEAKPAEPKPALPAVTELPVPPATPAEAKCLKSGGMWVSAGKSQARVCVHNTPDAGKSCSKETQCRGYCLARSGTCAPIVPLFGCNEIFQADGRMTTICID